MLAVILSIRCSPPEEGMLVPRAATAAAQSTTAMGCPSGMPGWTVMNWLAKSGRRSQDWAMRSSAAASSQ